MASLAPNPRIAAGKTSSRKSGDMLSEPEAWLLAQKEAFQVAMNGAPLAESLGVLVRATVRRFDGDARCAFYLANEAGTELHHIIGMPESYARAVDGFKIGPESLACGLAMHEGRATLAADVREERRWHSWLWLAEEHGFRACWSFPIETSAGLMVGTLAMYFAEPRHATPRDLEFASTMTQTAAIIISRNHEIEQAQQSSVERDRVAQALRDSERRLKSELLDMEQIQSISAEIHYDEDAEGLYEKILDVAVAIMHSDFGSIQMLYPKRGDGGELRLLTFRGFNPEAARFWQWIRLDSTTTCGAALRSTQRTIVSDIEQCDWMAGTEDLAMFRHTGIRSMQSTPLISRGGNLLGMISTHWREPHQPSERCLRMLDIVARQAADLTERKLAADRQKQAEIALRKSEKFAGAGRMAATIAHEINNPLEAMVNLWYLLGQEEELSESGHAQLKLLGEELGRVTHITKQTLEFYREGKTAAPFELADPINAAVKLFSRKAEVLGARIETRFRTSAAMFGFAGEMRQVFANLIGNSLEAGATRIQVRVSAGHDWTDPGRRGVRVMFADNGSGIAKESTRKLFEPFFTTKDEKGTGLGLWVSKGIVQKHEGRMRVRSSTRPDRRGTTFYLFLPTIRDRDLASKTVQSAGAENSLGKP